MRTNQQGVVVEPGGRIEGPALEENLGPTVQGRLRKGYTMQVGGGRTARTVFGPAIVSLDRTTAKLHMHKFENKAEIRKAFGWPQPQVHESLEESVQKRVNALAERNRGRAGTAGLAAPAVDEMVRAAVTREVDGLRAELPEMIGKALAAAIAGNKVGASSQSKEPKARGGAVTTKV